MTGMERNSEHCHHGQLCGRCSSLEPSGLESDLINFNGSSGMVCRVTMSSRCSAKTVVTSCCNLR